MSSLHRARVILLLGLLCTAGCQAKPARGRKAFGMGLLGGALAGAVVGNAIAKSSAAERPAAPAAPPVAQVVETGAPDANGCYRQTVKEPVPGNPKLYTETVHLVCPNQAAPVNTQPAIVVPMQMVPVAPPVVHPVVAPGSPELQPPPATSFNQTIGFIMPNSTATHTNSAEVHPGPASVPAPAPIPVGVAPAPVSGSAPVAAPAQTGGLHFVYAPGPLPTPAPVQPGASHVILLSKTVKKQKSAACTLNVSYSLLIFLLFCCLIRNRLNL